MSENIDRIWAPWRLEYIEAPHHPASGCFLCEILAANDDRENLVISRQPSSIALMNLHPYNNGHILVAPNRHLADLSDLTEPELLELTLLLRRSLKWLDAVYKPDGYNIGLNLGRVAGAGLPDHIHWHVVPRWSGDTNFMPIVGSTKIMSESLAAGYERLRKAADKDPMASGEES